MLKDVTTTLADVQKHLINLLPADAILLGHSLENDLQALKVLISISMGIQMVTSEIRE